MKDKFLAKRKEIMRTIIPYKDMGPMDWTNY